MGWFKRLKEGITTREKKVVPDGIWQQCKDCSATHTTKEWKENLYVCPSCGFHARIGSHDYFDILFDVIVNLWGKLQILTLW